MTKSSPWNAEIESAVIALINELHEHGESVGNQPLNSWQGWLQAEGYEATNLESFFLDTELLRHWEGEPSLAAAFKSASHDGKTTQEFLKLLEEQQPNYLQHTIDAADQLLANQQDLLTTAGGTQATHWIAGRKGWSQTGADIGRGAAVVGLGVAGFLGYRYYKNRELQKEADRLEKGYNDAVSAVKSDSASTIEDCDKYDSILNDKLDKLVSNKLTYLKQENDNINKSVEEKANKLEKFGDKVGKVDDPLECEFRNSKFNWDATKQKMAKAHEMNIQNSRADKSGELRPWGNTEYAAELGNIEKEARTKFANSKLAEFRRTETDKLIKINEDYDRQVNELERLIKSNAERKAKIAEENFKKDLSAYFNEEASVATEELKIDLDTQINKKANRMGRRLEEEADREISETIQSFEDAGDNILSDMG